MMASSSAVRRNARHVTGVTHRRAHFRRDAGAVPQRPFTAGAAPDIVYNVYSLRSLMAAFSKVRASPENRHVAFFSRNVCTAGTIARSLRIRSDCGETEQIVFRGRSSYVCESLEFPGRPGRLQTFPDVVCTSSPRILYI